MLVPGSLVSSVSWEGVSLREEVVSDGVPEDLRKRERKFH